MDHSTLAWLALVAFGFCFGVSASGPMALARIGIGLLMLTGLGLLLANTSGYGWLGHWFAIGMVAVAVAFLVALAGAFAGAAVRSLLRRRDPQTHRRDPQTA